MKILTANFDNQTQQNLPQQDKSQQNKSQRGISQQAQYQLIDSGNGYKLERFGNNIIARPDTNCVWKRLQPESEWSKAAAIFKSGSIIPSGSTATGRDNHGWIFKNNFKEPWTISYNNLKDICICKNQINL